MKKILLIWVPIFLAVAVGIGAFIAFANSEGRPKNPVKILRQAVSKHDAESFYKLVDVDSVLSSAAEEILTAQINSNIDALAYSTQNYVDTYEKLKPAFMDTAKAALDEYIATGKINFTPPLTDTQKFLKDSRVDTCEIKSFSKLKTIDGETHMTVELYNAGMNFYFKMNLTLERDEGGAWRIVNAKGFEDYLAGYNRTLRKKLETLNAPIRADIKEVFKLKGFSAAVSEGDEYGFSMTLKLTFKADVQSDKPIDSVVGQIVIDGKDGREGITPFTVNMVGREMGVQMFDVDKVLNPFVKEDAEVMRHGLKKGSLHINVTQINYADGTTLKEFDELP